MQVLYEDRTGKRGTYHPKLGYLRAGVPFDLIPEKAERYIKSGLLKKVEKEEEKNG